MASPRHPRILVVAEFPPGAGGGGWVILKQLLRGLDWADVWWWSLFGRPSSHHFGGRHRSLNVPAKLMPNRRYREIKGSILENIVVPYAARDFLAYAREIRPDFILFLAHDWTIPIVYRAMPHYKTHWHLALHDMPDTNGMVAALGPERAARFVRQTEELYKAASSRAVIGPGMEEDMRRRTGIGCDNYFRCAVEPELMARLHEPAPPPPTDPITIGYAGTIIAESTFARLVAALRVASRRLGRKVQIHLYSWHPYRERSWFDPEIVIEQGSRTESEIYALYRQMTWGLAIMNLEDVDPQYNHISFPCKFTSALAAGIPLICVGHRKSALMELAKNYGIGLLLTDEDADQLADKLTEYLADFSRFPGYRAEILRCAETEFNAERNREKFHALIRSSVAGGVT